MAKATKMPSSRFDGAPIDQPTTNELLLDNARVIITILQQMCQPRGVLYPSFNKSLVEIEP